METVALHEVKDDLSKYLRRAEGEEIVITRHGKAAGESERLCLRGRLVRLPPGE